MSYALHRSAEWDLTEAFRFYKAEAGRGLFPMQRRWLPLRVGEPPGLGIRQIDTPHETFVLRPVQPLDGGTAEGFDVPRGRSCSVPFGGRMRTTERGQTVVPARIRRDYGIEPHSRLEWLDDGHTIRHPDS